MSPILYIKLRVYRIVISFGPSVSYAFDSVYIQLRLKTPDFILIQG